MIHINYVRMKIVLLIGIDKCINIHLYKRVNIYCNSLYRIYFTFFVVYELSFVYIKTINNITSITTIVAI